jgi:hypothetical protein
LTECEDTGEGYPEWAAGVLKDMDNIGLPFIIEALLSDDDCRCQIGRLGLQWALGEADINSVLNANVRLASNAATNTDEHIRGAAKRWFGSWKGREEKNRLVENRGRADRGVLVERTTGNHGEDCRDAVRY